MTQAHRQTGCHHIRMGIFLTAASLLSSMNAPSLAAEPPLPAAFRTPDGSYTITVDSDIADPYFVNKAFIIALESGMNVRDELHAWLAWLLPRQRADGGFDRYCGARARAWHACMSADADDAMAAVTIHLIAHSKRHQLLPEPLRSLLRSSIQ